jgi:hypothetical protein
MVESNRFLLTALVACSFLASGGCTKPQEDNTPSPAAHVIRGKQLRKNENTLKQIALFYQTYVTENGKPPASLDDFKNYIKRDSRDEINALNEGSIVLLVNVQPGSKQVIAYEKDVDINGKQAVAMGDATVTTMRPDELKDALARQPR